MPAPSNPSDDVVIENRTHNHHVIHSSQHKEHHGFIPSTSTLLIIIPALCVVLLVIIAILIVTLRRLKSSDKGSEISKNNNNIDECKFIAHTAISFNDSPDIKSKCLHGGSSRRMPQTRLRGVQVFTYKELELATDGFSETNVIGNGGFGVVYRGVLGDGTVAAIKVMRREGKQGERAFRIEVDLLSRLNSPYLVELLGYCADQNHRLLIFEFMPNGSLQQHLHSRHIYPRPLDWGSRLRIALDCARALEYLHEHATPSIIHRDFKCSNVLLDDDFRAKVSDFGLAKLGSDKINGRISTRVLGTTGYLAPEYVSTGKLTTKSDVYSYGVVLLQLITGRVPIDTRRSPGEHVLISWALPRLTSRDEVIEMVDPALKGHYTKKDLIQIAAIAAVCVQPEADYRPLMTDVVQSLIPLVKNLNSISSSSARFSTHCLP
ncbi:putative serine/threonine-protein kinase PBL7 [Drosera capensis]